MAIPTMAKSIICEKFTAPGAVVPPLKNEPAGKFELILGVGLTVLYDVPIAVAILDPNDASADSDVCHPDDVGALGVKADGAVNTGFAEIIDVSCWL
jgi:hypothetical protein